MRERLQSLNLTAKVSLAVAWFLGMAFGACLIAGGHLIAWNFATASWAFSPLSSSGAASQAVIDSFLGYWDYDWLVLGGLGINNRCYYLGNRRQEAARVEWNYARSVPSP